MIAFSGCLFSAFRQRPRKGHFLESAQFRFTQSPEQGMRRGRLGRSISLQCLVGGTLREWLDRNVTRMAGSGSPHYERRFRAPERMFSMKASRIANSVGRKLEVSTVAVDQASALPRVAPAADQPTSFSVPLAVLSLALQVPNLPAHTFNTTNTSPL
jgi:hypothetical protein